MSTTPTDVLWKPTPEEYRLRVGHGVLMTVIVTGWVVVVEVMVMMVMDMLWVVEILEVEE